MHEGSIRAWEAVLAAFEKEVGDAASCLWLEGSHLQSLEEDSAEIVLPNPFAREWIERNHRERIERLLSGVLDRPVRCHFGTVKPVEPRVGSTTTRSRSPRGKTHWKTFVEPVVGPFNQVALAALRNALDHPGETCPILVYGEEGLGKTTLLSWYARKLSKRHPNWRIRRLSGDSFCRRLQKAHATGQVAQMQRFFRNLDALIVDDLHELEGRKGTQRELLHTLDHLSRRRRPIVFSCHTAPAHLESFSQPLCSRIRGGLVLPLERPCSTAVRDYLTMLCARAGTHIDPELLDHVARQFPAPFSQVEQLVNHLGSLHSQSRLPLGKRHVNRLIELFTEHIESRTLPGICRETAAVFDIEPDRLQSQTRERRVTRARRIAMYLATELSGTSKREIGRYFGGRTPATVSGAIRWIRTTLSEDPELSKHIESVRARL